MQINSIPGISPITNGVNIGSTLNKAEGTSSFTDVLKDAMNQASQAESENMQSTNALLSGANESPDVTMIAAQKAELTLDLAMQIRNKMIDAYNDVMKMQL